MKKLLLTTTLLGLLNVLTFLSTSNTFIGVVIFALLTLIPGNTVLHIARYSNKTIVEKVSLSFGFGTLFLLLFGLGINETLPLLGIIKPLSQIPFMISYNITLLALIFIRFYMERRITTPVRLPKFSMTTVLFAAVSFVLPAGAIMGAVSLNNHGTNIIALTMYILIGIYSFIAFGLKKKLSDNKMAFALFVISLSLLFMNSFRGWYNTGHDIQREFYVFNLTKLNGLWDMDLYRDPYNACLSLTILPTIYSIITKINDYYIFKIFYQILFSFTVINIFYLLRRYFAKPLAYIAALSFIFFPTFMTDLPMLNRQELAFLFLSIFLYILFDNTISKIRKTTLVIAVSTGVVLSHYSTSYLSAALFALAYGASIAFSLFQKLLHKVFHIRAFATSLKSEQNLNIFIVGFLLLFTVFWNGFFTGTAKNIQETIVDVTKSLSQPFGEKEKSGETLYSIFNYKPLSPEKSLEMYMDDATRMIRLPKEEAAFYEKDVYTKYPIKLSEQEILKPMIDVPLITQKTKTVDLMANLRQSYAKLLQVLILVGMIVFIFSKRHTHKIPKEFYMLSVVSLFLITLQVILPQSAVSYGVLRLFQQSLMVFSIFIVLGLFWTLRMFMIRKESLREYIIMTITVVYFFLLSGVIPQLIGGYYPQLPLNNNGTYYNMYYTHASEISALEWVGQFVTKKSPLQSDSFDAAKIKTYAKSFPVSASFPAVIKKNAYVYLNYSNAKLQRAYLYYNGAMLVYKFPTDFLDENKNLIYSSSEAKVYR